jgi:predicted TIM-barrel fold metal-dependent hydrolase
MTINHRLCKNLYHHAGLMKLPIIFHLTQRHGGIYGLVDKVHVPGLEEVLREFPETIFIGHAPAFWNEIDGDIKPGNRGGYPKGPIKKAGRLWELMEKYPNLYGDISAGSGFNAISRDLEAGYRFIKKFHKKIFFGTDCFFVKEEPPEILTYFQNALKNKKITKTAYENIMSKNFLRVFK